MMKKFEEVQIMTKKSEKVPRITKMWHRDYKVNSCYWKTTPTNLLHLGLCHKPSISKKERKSNTAKRNTEMAEREQREVCLYIWCEKCQQRGLQVHTLYTMLFLLEWDPRDKLMDTCNVSVNLAKELQTVRTVVKPRTETIRTGKEGKSRFSHLSFVLVDVCF